MAEPVKIVKVVQKTEKREKKKTTKKYVNDSSRERGTCTKAIKCDRSIFHWQSKYNSQN